MTTPIAIVIELDLPGEQMTAEDAQALQESLSFLRFDPKPRRRLILGHEAAERVSALLDALEATPEGHEHVAQSRRISLESRAFYRCACGAGRYAAGDWMLLEAPRVGVARTDR